MSRIRPLPCRSLLRWADAYLSGSKIENNDQVVSQYTAIVGTKMVVQTGIVIQPPEGRPPEDHEAGAGASQSLQLPDSGCVIRRASPVLPTSFQERDGAPAPDRLLGSPLVLVNQDERILRSDQRCNLLPNTAKPGHLRPQLFRVVESCTHPAQAHVVIRF